MTDALLRQEIIELAREVRPWDVIVVGGGCAGLGAAVEAAARGYRTLLVEREDFTSGTSSRSTKLIHGGVRYLRQGHISLVMGALKERGRLRRNAPHLVSDLSLVIPAYSVWEKPYYGVGLKAYDLLAGGRNLGRSQLLSRRGALDRISTLRGDGLRGGVLFHDGQFDDARLGWTLVRTLLNLGGVAVNRVEAVGFIESRGGIRGVRLRDAVDGTEWEARASVVVNATGPWADETRAMDEPDAGPGVVISQGSHIVVSSSFLPGSTAVLVPSTDDGRVLFAIPWHDHVIIGTTDVALPGPTRSPAPSADEVDYLIDHAARYLYRPPARSDVLSAWSGLRALARSGSGGSTAELSRDHAISVSRAGLVTVVGGKWTTYRKMGQDTIDRAAEVGHLSPVSSRTARMRLHGHDERTDRLAPWRVYGSDADRILELEAGKPALAEVIQPSLPYRKSQVVWAARHEMATSVEDVLMRRTRALYLNATAALEAAPLVAELMAEALGHGPDWIEGQVAAFEAVARTHVPA
ncbi:MAG: glycerol-3-phosphate dehydrogenase/oxidase [Gemmatimonadetes bacterium]|nr:glycerol-3-phosphate dehydrogenase/oxidase [Gemmatimonadota bacterium]